MCWIGVARLESLLPAGVDVVARGRCDIAVRPIHGPECRPTRQEYHGRQSHLRAVPSIMSAMNDAIPADGLPNASRSDQNDEHDCDYRYDRDDQSPAARDSPGATNVDRPARVDRRPLVIALAITTTFFIVELIGAY